MAGQILSAIGVQYKEKEDEGDQSSLEGQIREESWCHNIFLYVFCLLFIILIIYIIQEVFIELMIKRKFLLCIKNI